ncbi:ethanolamine utilization protein EutH [Alkalicoccus urumqiensis]|uniref:ethanolamine utilization protein EutH n=1 Tax=Alkalicoccus urumqiensis TaxID=1548213 RepID=UPI0015E5F552|nr:ethanolamine utilization protein EutH [Alkalicoccus urumqiensis]
MNSIVIWTLLFFLAAAVLDKTFGNRFGYGRSLDEAFQAMGPLAFVMVGMISIAPVLADFLRPVLVPVFSLAGVDPGMFPGMILAVDMGGYPLSTALADNPDAGLLSGIILSTMLGPVFVFTVPVALGLIQRQDHKLLAEGIMYGLIPVPAGALLAGVTAGMEVTFLIQQLLPVILFISLCAAGLFFFRRIVTALFLWGGRMVMAVSSILIGILALQEVGGVVLVDGMTPFADTMEIIGVIVLALAGAFPFVHFLRETLIPKATGLLEKTPLPAETWTAFITQLAHSIPMYKNLHLLDERSKVMNIAFSVSGAFLLGGHLGFTAAVEPGMVTAMLVGKASAGVMAVLLVYAVKRKQIQQ